MFNVGSGELLAIIAVALIILGPGRLPDAVRTAGRVMGELRRISGNFQQELRNALDDREVDEEFERPRNTQAAALHPPPANETAAGHQAADTASAPRSTTRQPATSRPNPTGPPSGSTDDPVHWHAEPGA